MNSKERISSVNCVRLFTNNLDQKSKYQADQCIINDNGITHSY